MHDIDFPEGSGCPLCPFWKGKQGSRAKPRKLEAFVLKFDDFLRSHQ